MDNSHINGIIIKVITDEELTLAESAEFDLWLKDTESSKLFEDLKNNEYLLQGLVSMHEIDEEADKVLLQEKLGIGKRIHLIKRQWKLFRDVATSAAAVLVLAAATFFWMNTRKTNEKTVPTQKTATVVDHNIEPGKTAALLTLADNSKIVLDSTVTGSLTQQGGMLVVNENSTLKYQEKNSPPHESLFNTLSTANGQTYSMVLADGSKVWLNTGASIRFPVAFTGNERSVEITGEAYFEVAPDKSKPFIVKVLPPTGRGAGGGRGGMDVQVLGTHFNINAYNEEAVIKTTLLEGSVKIKQGNSETLLKPGQQAQVGAGKAKVLNNVNMDAAIAWKNGRFNFDNDEIGVVMNQLKKWYNVETAYEGPRPTKLFIGEMERNQLLSEVIKMLEMTGGVHFIVEGHKLIAMTPETYEAWKANNKQKK
jgi:ferric-dicitrate binding protein FerR (iron transport regulator)